MLRNLGLARRFLWRETRAGEWILVFLALSLSVAALTALHFYTDRLTRAWQEQSSRMLGGDLVISSPTPIPQTWLEQAKTLHLQSAEVWSYLSMLSTPAQVQLANIQAVSATYPLIDHAKARPQAAELWVDPRVYTALNLKMGAKINLGIATFTLAQTLGPNDGLISSMIIAPRVLMRLEDVAATQTVLLGSQVDYRLMIAGDKNQLASFLKGLQPQLSSSQKILDASNQQKLLVTIFDRTQNYLQLVLVICFMLSGVAIAVSVQQYLRRHYQDVVLWRCMGAQTKDIWQIFLLQLLMVALLAGSVGVVLGLGAQLMLERLLSEVFALPLPEVSLQPMLLGLASALVLLFAFAYPLLSELPQVRPTYLWQRLKPETGRASLLYFGSSLLILIAFIMALMDGSLLALFLKRRLWLS